jgi:enoyl-CoA hydratase/carnithine racemase
MLVLLNNFRIRLLEIQINRADKKNALTAAMYNDMSMALKDASGRAHIRVVLIRGVGDTFCAGNDLRDFMSNEEGGVAAFIFIRAIAMFEKPIIVAVQGPAVGIGTTMLLHCDLVYASPDAQFLMPFVNLGIIPEAGSSMLAPKTFGYAKAAAMLLLGEPVDAKEAEQMGLVTRIIPADQLVEHVRMKAYMLANKPPAAVLATRRLMKGDLSALERFSTVLNRFGIPFGRDF